jgi:hypothetical protein
MKQQHTKWMKISGHLFQVQTRLHKTARRGAREHHSETKNVEEYGSKNEQRTETRSRPNDNAVGPKPMKEDNDDEARLVMACCSAPCRVAHALNGEPN